MRGRALIAAIALLLPAAAIAQDAARPIDEAASDLAYGYCPLYLSEQFPLTGNPQLAALGFGETIEKKVHPRFGEMQMVSTKLPDGGLGFGGAPGKICSVVAMGPKLDAVLATLRKNMALTGLDFKPDAGAQVPSIPGVTVETFKASVEGQLLYVQLIHAGGPTPMVSAQLFVMDQ